MNHDFALNVEAGSGNDLADPLDELPIAYLELNAEGTVTRSNRAARAMYSDERVSIVGRAVWDFAPQGQADALREEFLAMMSSGITPPIIRRSLYCRGEFRTHEVHRTLIRDAEGRTQGVRAATFDVTETQIAHEEAHRARMWLESVLHSMSEAIVITDALGFIRSVNTATEELFGWKAGELEGKVIEKAFPLLAYSADDNVKLNFNMALQGRSRGVATLLDHQRTELQVELSTSPIVDKINGFTIGVVSVMRRVSGARQNATTP